MLPTAPATSINAQPLFALDAAENTTPVPVDIVTTSSVVTADFTSTSSFVFSVHNPRKSQAR
ncbi:hypothetical protein BPO_p0066 (plasmid) [Bergeyella porcorum]|uniref:Uncharacterized protein n=1 Tax=Bergeyella porcorum TaxID=1735111 RepID=A0AAU0F4I0_9FLAO